jgi:transposase
MSSLSTDGLTRNELEQLIERLLHTIENQAKTIEEKDKTIEEQAKTIKQLKEVVAELREKKEDSSNSGKPPSSDSPKEREKRRRRKRNLKRRAKRKQGAQKGHEGHHRQLVPPECVDQIVDCHAEDCDCGAGSTTNTHVERHQVFEIPPISPEVIEYRIHSNNCAECGKTNQGKLPEGVTQSPFGPRLVALICLLTGLYRMSKRQTARFLQTILGVTISTGAICRCEKRMSGALAKPVGDLLQHIQKQSVKHTDATSWRQSGLRRQLWTIATTLTTVFVITLNGTMDTVKRLLGKPIGILVSDRAKAFLFWPKNKRQVCWAHLIRMFVKFTERSGESYRIGEELLARTRMLFMLWHRVRDGTLKRSSFRQYTYGIRKTFRGLLEEGKTCTHKRTAGSCRELLKLFESMWTFVRVEGVEPTNNHAEQEIRHLILWRRTSFGTQSESGSLYIGRIGSVVSTLRKQRRDVLEYLTSAYRANLEGGQPPSLLPSESTCHGFRCL